MKRVRNNIRLFITGAVIVLLNACGGGGGGGGNNNATIEAATPYPDPKNPSLYPTKQDDYETGGGNNTSNDATVIQVDGQLPPFDGVQYHTIYSVDDEDWFKVSLPNNIAYEFSVDNVSVNSFTKLELYESDGSTLIDEDFGYFASNPRILFTPPAGGDYYLRVDGQLGAVSSYTISAHEFLDDDSDTYSTYYDCDDASAATHPLLEETQGGTAGDTVDQSCTGYDWLAQNLEDSFENSDDTNSSTVTIPMVSGDPWDVIHRQEVYAETHTIDTVSGDDVDYFKVTVPPDTAYEVLPIETTGSLSMTIYDSDGVSVIEPKAVGIYAWLDNSVNAPGYYNATPASDKVWYIKIEATNSGEEGVYAIGLVDYGTDMDEDGAYSQYYGASWDCDDSNPDVYGAFEAAPDDGIDSNCNGLDDI